MIPSSALRFSTNATYYCYRIVYASEFSLIALLRCIVMIGAIPAGSLNRAAAEKIVRRQGGPGLCTDVGYVPLLLEVACGGSTNLVKKSLSQADSSVTSVQQLMTFWIKAH